MEKEKSVEKEKQSLQNVKKEIDSNDYSFKYKELIKYLNKLENDLQKSGKLNNDFISLKENTKKILNSLDTEKRKINKLYVEIFKFYDNKYLPLFREINDSKKGLKPTFNLILNKEKRITEIRDISLKKFNILKKQINDYKQLSESLLTLFENTKKTAILITERNKNSNDIYESTKKLNEQVKKFLIEIEDYKNQSEILYKQINELSLKSNKHWTDIVKFHTDAKNKLNEINSIYEIAADTGRGGEFDKRRNHLKIELEKWEKRIRNNTVLLTVFIILLFIFHLCLVGFKIKDLTFDLSFYLRFLMTSPVIFYLYFCTTQYQKTKILHDKYSFKTTLAFSIQSHLELLSKNDDFNDVDHINKILDFSLNGFSKIYQEPYNNNDENIKVNLKLKELEVGIERIRKSLSDNVNKVNS
ncbi:MAG: hypothetical protein NTZ33_15655 [Bacteroidetes bacterium]|nr:hypothetical protein [Bacteroidota bacterium]